MKLVENIVNMAENALAADESISVTTLKLKQVKPVVNLLVTEKDKYTAVNIEQYNEVYELITNWDTVDIVNFTLLWPDGSSVVVTRAFNFEDYDKPVVESVIQCENSVPVNGQMYVRNDTLSTYSSLRKEKPKANVRGCRKLMHKLCIYHDLDWPELVNALGGHCDWGSILLGNVSLEHFVTDEETRILLKRSSVAMGMLPMPSDQAASHILRGISSDIIHTITKGLFGVVNDESVNHVIEASAVALALGIVTDEMKETVYAVHTSVGDIPARTYLTFGCRDEKEAIQDFTTEFELEVENLDGMKAIELVYLN